LLYFSFVFVQLFTKTKTLMTADGIRHTGFLNKTLLYFIY
jgi:hypothetical protein